MRILTAILAVLIAMAAPGFSAKSARPAETLRLASVSADSVPMPSPAVRSEQIRDILSRREFGGSQVGLFDRLKAWFGRILGQAAKAIFGSLTLGESNAKWISAMLAVTVVSLFLAFLAWVLMKIGLSRFVRGRDEEVSELYQGPDTPNLALAEASRAADAGDYRTALRLVYLAVLLRLDERDLIRFDRTGTNWEYLSTLRSEPDIHRLLRPVTVVFDRKWYGREPAAEGDYRGFVEAYEAVELVGAAE